MSSIYQTTRPVPRTMQVLTGTPDDPSGSMGRKSVDRQIPLLFLGRAYPVHAWWDSGPELSDRRLTQGLWPAQLNLSALATPCNYSAADMSEQLYDCRRCRQQITCMQNRLAVSSGWHDAACRCPHVAATATFSSGEMAARRRRRAGIRALMLRQLNLPETITYRKCLSTATMLQIHARTRIRPGELLTTKEKGGRSVSEFAMHELMQVRADSLMLRRPATICCRSPCSHGYYPPRWR